MRGWVMGMVLATLAASPQILATAELISQSVRAGGMSGVMARTGAMPPQELVSTVLPSFFGFERPADMVQSYVHRADGYFGGGVSHWDTTAYLGVSALLLAGLGLRAGRFWIGMAAVAVLANSSLQARVLLSPRPSAPRENCAAKRRRPPCGRTTHHPLLPSAPL